MRTGIYARCSVAAQHGNSLELQVATCGKRALSETWEVVEIFTDEPTGGLARARPGLSAALDAVRDGRLDVLLAQSLDRVSRDVCDLAGIVTHLREHQCELVSASKEFTEMHRDASASES